MYGDDVSIPQESARQWLAVTPLQYAKLGAWARGRFIDDRDGAVACRGTSRAGRGAARCGARPGGARVLPGRRVPPRHRGAVDAAVRPCGRARSGCACARPRSKVDYGAKLTRDVVLAPDGPLQGSAPGDLTRWLGVPWHSDAASCRSGYQRRISTVLPTFWPARIPNQVLIEADYRIVMDRSRPLAERQAAFPRRHDWERFVARPTRPKTLALMITEWPRLGMVTVRPGPGDAEFPSTLKVETYVGFEGEPKHEYGADVWVPQDSPSSAAGRPDVRRPQPRAPPGSRSSCLGGLPAIRARRKPAARNRGARCRAVRALACGPTSTAAPTATAAPGGATSSRSPTSCSTPSVTAGTSGAAFDAGLIDAVRTRRASCRTAVTHGSHGRVRHRRERPLGADRPRPRRAADTRRRARRGLPGDTSHRFCHHRRCRGEWLGLYVTGNHRVPDGRRSAPRLTGCVTDASTSWLDRIAGPGWAATGDAAAAFDPLSSQGIVTALVMGREAGRVAAGTVRPEEYEAQYASLLEEHLALLKAYYGLERRWADSDFWRRRPNPNGYSTLVDGGGSAMVTGSVPSV